MGRLQALRPSSEETKCLALCALLAALFIHDWDGFVFETAVRQLWDGTTPYETGRAAPWYSLLGTADHEPQWYAYPPLPLLLMALTFLPAIVLDLPEPVQRLLLKLPVIVGHIALARVAGAWGARASADAGRLATRLTLWNPFLILIGPVWGMTDGLLMALLLGGVLAFLNGRPAWGGVLVAAALLVKPFPALLGVPLLAWVAARRGTTGLARAGAAAGATFLAVILPFWMSEPTGFWRQVAGAHLSRGAQGLTIWRWPGFDGLAPQTVQVASMVALAVALGLASWWALGRRGPEAPVEVVLIAALAVLLVNRVVNEQYVAMVVVPLLILAATQSRWALPSRWVTRVMTAAVVLTGFHFLTFIPPDVALLLLRRPVDEVAQWLRVLMPYFWDVVSQAFLFIVPPLLAWIAWRLARPEADAPGLPRWHAGAVPSLLLCALLVGGGAVAAPESEPEQEFVPAFEEPSVSTFYYLWWNNPAHDPGTLYGNWLPVSQSPEIGYYTNNRGIARLHAQQMVENGIDTAIISYHRGELPRYQVFQEEAAREGLWVVPLIELNQIYDKVVDGKRIHRPIDENGREAVYAAYRLSEGVQDAIEAFILDLEHQLQAPNQLRIDGRPVVMFYDAYVSGVSFHGEDRDRLAQAVVDTYPAEALREHYDDPSLLQGQGPAYEDMLRYHPISYQEFFGGPRHAPWRGAHLELHERFWHDLKANVEARTGPLFWISGEAYNERAGFEAGIPQALDDLEIFDGSFIYSPSFTWGTNQGLSDEEIFRIWEDRNHWLQAYANGAGRMSVIGIAPAYDDTVNRPDIGFVIPDQTPHGSMYERSWSRMVETPPGMVAISTWNEYFEGSSIEPSKEFGDAWLRATAAHRQEHATALATEHARPELVMITSERQSRLHWNWSETDTSHMWSMDMVAAGVRAFPDHRPVAIDALSHRIDTPQPDVLLVEGARGDHVVSAEVYALLQEWLGTVPAIIFGPDALGIPIEGEAEPCRVPGRIAEPWTLQPGDRLVGSGGSLSLQRGNQDVVVGVACSDAPAFTNVKPYGSGDARADAACLALTVEVLLREGSGECRVA